MKKKQEQKEGVSFAEKNKLAYLSRIANASDEKVLEAVRKASLKETTLTPPFQPHRAAAAKREQLLGDK